MDDEVQKLAYLSLKLVLRHCEAPLYKNFVPPHVNRSIGGGCAVPRLFRKYVCRFIKPTHTSKILKKAANRQAKSYITHCIILPMSIALKKSRKFSIRIYNLYKSYAMKSANMH
jgi:hypothetical protein